MSVSYISARWVWKGHTYVDTPEFLNRVEGDDLLQQLAPVLLAAGRLGEPQRPGVLQRVLDVEVGRVVKDGDDLAVISGLLVGCIGYTALGRDWDGVQRDLLVRHWLRDFGHVGWCVGVVSSQLEIGLWRRVGGDINTRCEECVVG